jgi:hypothetical protein
MLVRHGLPVALAMLASLGFVACSSSSSGLGLKSADGSTGTGGANAVDSATNPIDAPSGGSATGADGLTSPDGAMTVDGATAVDAPGGGGATSTGGVSGTGGATSSGDTATGGCRELGVVAVCIDGSDWLHIQGTKGWFTHGSYEAAGTHSDCSTFGMLGVVTVNGTNTPLTWPNGSGTGQPSSTFTLPLAVPTVDGTLLLTPVQARAGLSVSANPASTNSYEGDIFIDDSAIPGAAVYDFRISWCTGGVTGAGGVTGTGGATGSGGSNGSSDASSSGSDWCGTGSVTCGTGTCEANAICKSAPTATSSGSCTCPLGYQRQACDGMPCAPDNSNCPTPNRKCVKMCADGAPCLVSAGMTCGANGNAAEGTTWVVTNSGGSGTIDVNASASNVYAGGVPAVSQQFAVVAGATYLLTVCVAANLTSTCVSPLALTCSSGYGPVLDVEFPGTSSPALSSTLSVGKNTVVAVGAPTISLTEGSNCIVTYDNGREGTIPCPPPAGCITTNASGATCSVAGDLYCGTVCCSPSNPYFCSATKKCYPTSKAAANACGSVSCAECVAPS